MAKSITERLLEAVTTCGNYEPDLATNVRKYKVFKLRPDAPAVQRILLARKRIAEGKPEVNESIFAERDWTLYRYYLGKAGSLRISRTGRVADSIPAADRMRKKLLDMVPA